MFVYVVNCIMGTLVEGRESIICADCICESSLKIKDVLEGWGLQGGEWWPAY